MDVNENDLAFPILLAGIAIGATGVAIWVGLWVWLLN